MSDDRTEQPTNKKLRDARRKGQVLRSRDVHDVAQLGAVLLALGWFGRPLVEGLGRSMSAGLVEMGANAHRPISDADLAKLAMQAGLLIAVLVGPIALASLLGGIAASTAQGGWTFTTEPLTLNFGKLNPANGFKRLAPSKAGLDLVRTLLAMTGLVWIAIDTVEAMVQDSTTLGRVTTGQAAVLAWSVADSYLKRAWVVMAVLAGGDYLLQRFRFMQGQKMTKQEVKDEMRMSEGAPEIKARVRRAQRAMARKRMLAAVPKATVVVTNPTHFAVALEYKREAMFAPKVVAKGADHLAARIKAVAKEHNVPIVENVVLARALYTNAEVGDSIPGDLFEAVAEVLAYLIKLKQLVF